jgi:hypothetical protein
MSLRQLLGDSEVGFYPVRGGIRPAGSRRPYNPG